MQSLLQHPGPEDAGASQAQGLQESLPGQEDCPVQPPAPEEGADKSSGHPQGCCEPQELPESYRNRGGPNSLQTQVRREQQSWLPAVVRAAAAGIPALAPSLGPAHDQCGKGRPWQRPLWGSCPACSACIVWCVLIVSGWAGAVGAVSHGPPPQCLCRSCWWSLQGRGPLHARTRFPLNLP